MEEEEENAVLNGFDMQCISKLLPKDCMGPNLYTTWITIWEGYLSLIISIIGVIGNSMSLAVLLDPAYLDVFNKLLVSLSVCDTVFLGNDNVQYNYNNVYIP